MPWLDLDSNWIVSNLFAGIVVLFLQTGLHNTMLTVMQSYEGSLFCLPPNLTIFRVVLRNISCRLHLSRAALSAQPGTNWLAVPSRPV